MLGLKEKADKLIRANAKKQKAEDNRAMKSSKKAGTRLKQYAKKKYKTKYGWDV